MKRTDQYGMQLEFKSQTAWHELKLLLQGMSLLMSILIYSMKNS